jgi:hypothetical protein
MTKEVFIKEINVLLNSWNLNYVSEKMKQLVKEYEESDDDQIDIPNVTKENREPYL